MPWVSSAEWCWQLLLLKFHISSKFLPDRLICPAQLILKIPVPRSLIFRRNWAHKSLRQFLRQFCVHLYVTIRSYNFGISIEDASECYDLHLGGICFVGKCSSADPPRRAGLWPLTLYLCPFSLSGPVIFFQKNAFQLIKICMILVTTGCLLVPDQIP